MLTIFQDKKKKKKKKSSFTSPLAFLLGRVLLKAGRCIRRSIWLFDLRRGQGTGGGVYGKQGACKKAKTTVYVWSDHAFTNYSVPLESGPASGAYRGSLL